MKDDLFQLKYAYDRGGFKEAQQAADIAIASSEQAIDLLYKSQLTRSRTHYEKDLTAYGQISGILTSKYVEFEYKDEPLDLDAFFKETGFEGRYMSYALSGIRGTAERPFHVRMQQTPAYFGYKAKHLILTGEKVSEGLFTDAYDCKAYLREYPSKSPANTNRCDIFLPGKKYRDGKLVYDLKAIHDEIHSAKIFLPDQPFSVEDFRAGVNSIIEQIEPLCGAIKEVRSNICLNGGVVTKTLEEVLHFFGKNKIIEEYSLVFESPMHEITISSMYPIYWEKTQRKSKIAAGAYTLAAGVAFTVDVAFGGILTAGALAFGYDTWRRKKNFQRKKGYAITVKPTAYEFSTAQIQDFVTLEKLLSQMTIS